MGERKVKAWVLLKENGMPHESLDGFNFVGIKKVIKGTLEGNESAVPCVITYKPLRKSKSKRKT